MSHSTFSVYGITVHLTVIINFVFGLSGQAPKTLKKLCTVLKHLLIKENVVFSSCYFADSMNKMSLKTKK